MFSHIRVLLIEDNPGDARLVKEMLSETERIHLTKWINTLEEGLRFLLEQSVDAVILDLGLPDQSGLGVIRQITEKVPQLPVVVLTGNRDHELALQALNEGAQDFLFKDSLTAPFLERSIRHAIERQHLVTKLKATTHELDQANRSIKATQSQMLQQEKMASIGQLAAGVAHEINNPVGFIKSNLGSLSKYQQRLAEFIAVQDLALAENNPDKAGESRRKLKIDLLLEDIPDLIQESLQGMERIQTIVQDLKSFSRADNKEPVPADLNTCLTNTIQIAWNEIKYRSTLLREFGDLPQVYCFPNQLNQVFLNLLVNAAQAIEEQGEITVRTWHAGDDVFISVSDTGTGIPPENLEKIFDPFFTTKPAGKGTGLGLSISYDIIRKHGGELRVDSTPGRGTTFTIQLPVNSTLTERKES